MSESTLNRRVVLAFLAVLVAMGVQGFLGVSPARALAPTPDDTWMTNGTVFDSALSEDGTTLYIGGRFTVAKDRAGTKVTRVNLAAIDVATGSVVSTWRPQVTSTSTTTPAVVRAIAVKNGKVYVGGSFTHVNGQARANIAAVDAISGATDPNFVHTVSDTNTSLVPIVFGLTTSDSKLYAGGRYNLVDGARRGKLAAFDLATGALDPAWRPRTDNQVLDVQLASDGASIFVMGKFNSVTGTDGATAARKTVARFDTATGNIHPWAIPAGVIRETQQTAWTAVVTPTRLYVGLGDTGSNYVAAFSLATGDLGSQIWRFNTVGDPQTLALSPDGTRLFFGGHFGLVRLEQQVCGGQYLRGLGSLNPLTGQLYCDWLPRVEPFRDNGRGPWAMTITGNTHLWVGGGFTGISGVPQSNLARFTL